MQRRLLPGLAFSLPIDVGFAVGLATHDVARLGTLVWIAQPIFDDAPTLNVVSEIEAWRWPVFFPLNAALRRQIVTKIGHVAIPQSLETMPYMRSRATLSGKPDGVWNLVSLAADGSFNTSRHGQTTDPSVPIYRVVNDTALKEKIVTGWRSSDEW
jgi:hypothetical protein